MASEARFLTLLAFAFIVPTIWVNSRMRSAEGVKVQGRM